MSEKEAPERDKYLLSSVNNTLSLLDILAAKGPLTLAELDRTTSFGKTTLFRMMHTLEENDFVAKDTDGRYALGLKLLYLGSSVVARQDLTEVARPHLAAFSAEHGLSTHLARLSSTRVVTIDVETPVADLQVTGRVGMSPRAHSTAMGRAILANLSAEELEAILPQFKYVEYTASSITSAEDLMVLLDQVRKRGYALDINDRYAGFASVAAPVFDFQHKCVAACGIVALAQVVEERQDQIAQAVMELADKVSAALGAKR